MKQELHLKMKEADVKGDKEWILKEHDIYPHAMSTHFMLTYPAFKWKTYKIIS